MATVMVLVVISGLIVIDRKPIAHGGGIP